MLTTSLTGITLDNPLILAAGILGSTGASLRRVAKSGAGAVVTKSLGTTPRRGHPNPSMLQLDGGFINALGLPNPSYHPFRDEIETAKQGGVPVIASIFGGMPEEFEEIASALSDCVDGFELNVSCPHAAGYGAEIGSSPVMVEEITRRVKKTTSLPVWVKLTPNVTDITDIGLAAERGGADAVVAINTLRAMVIDIETGYPILSNRFGGLSGSPIKPVAVKAVYDLYGALEIPVIGVGGIATWQDAVEMMMAGASALQIGSAVYTGLTVFRDISSGIATYLRQRDLVLEDIIGLAHRVKGGGCQ